MRQDTKNKLFFGLGTIGRDMSGINGAAGAQDVAPQGIAMLKSAMLFIPLLYILAGYWVYSKKYRIDERFYHDIVRDLEQRGDINPT